MSSFNASNEPAASGTSREAGISSWVRLSGTDDFMFPRVRDPTLFIDRPRHRDDGMGRVLYGPQGESPLGVGPRAVR